MLVILVLAAFVLAMPATVSAAPAGKNVVTVDLLIGDALPPTHVCIVHNTGAPGQSHLSFATWTGALEWSQRKGPGIDDSMSPGEKGWAAQLSPDASDILPKDFSDFLAEWEAIRGLASGSERSCFEDPEVAGCRPGLWVTDFATLKDSKVTCSLNQASVVSGTRVLVLQLQALHKSKTASLDNFALVGDSIALNVGRWDVESQKVVVAVLGGHYQPSAGRHSVGHLVSLPLAPICDWREFSLPTNGVKQRWREEFLFRIGEGPTFAIARDHGCIERGRINAVALRLPVGSSTATKRLGWRIHRAPRSRRSPAENPVNTRRMIPIAEFVARWRGRESQDPIPLSIRTVQFSWSTTDGCGLELHEPCPEASLINTGVRCQHLNTQPDSARCRYRCSDSDKDDDLVAAVLPTTVRFRRQGIDEEWEMPLVRINQQLQGRAPRVHVRVDISGWGDLARARGQLRSGHHDGQYNALDDALVYDGEPVEGVTLWPGTAHPYSVTFRPLAKGEATRLHVDIPRERCTEPVPFRLDGSDRLASDTTRVANGTLVLGDPSEVGRVGRLHVALSAGGALALSVERPDVAKPSPLGAAYADLVVGGAFRPRKSPRLTIEAGISYSIFYGARYAYRLPTDVDATPGFTESRAYVYNVWSARFALLGVLYRRLRLGADVGVGPGFALTGRAYDEFGVKPIWYFSPIFRWRWKDQLELSTGTRFMRWLYPSYDIDGAGTPIARSRGLAVIWWVGLDLRPVFRGRRE